MRSHRDRRHDGGDRNYEPHGVQPDSALVVADASGLGGQIAADGFGQVEERLSIGSLSLFDSVPEKASYRHRCHAFPLELGIPVGETRISR